MLDRNPEPSFAEIKPFIGELDALFYCAATGDKLSDSVLPRLKSAVEKAEARESKKPDVQPAKPADVASASQTDVQAELARPDPLGDVVTGSANAPVTVLEYGSVWDAPTIDFARKYFPKLKADYLDAGKVRFIYREWPSDIISHAGALLIRCIARNDDAKYLQMLGEIFNDPRLLSGPGGNKLEILYGATARYGLDRAATDNCINAKRDMDALNDFLGRTRQTLQVRTPQFYVNGQQIPYRDDRLYPYMEKLIKSALATNSRRQ